MKLPGWPGYHWYAVPRVGSHDHDTFFAAYREWFHTQRRLIEKKPMAERYRKAKAA